MANRDNPNGFKVAQTTHGNEPMMLSGLTITGLTLNPGDFLIRDPTTGLIDIATASSTAILGLCQSKVTGETGVSKMVNFIPATPDVIFEGQCSGTPTQDLIGTACDIEGTTGIMEINENATSQNVIQLVGLAKCENNTMGLNARLLFVVKESSFTGI